MKTPPLVLLLRPHQWVKNLMIFFPPFLGGQLTASTGLTGTPAFISFCLASSGAYIINDLVDRERDRFHPRKRNRPIAAGDISISVALGISVALIISAAVVAASVSVPFLALVASYFIVSTSYSFLLKTIPLVDIFCIASGFLLRLLAGGEAFEIDISEWLFLTVFLLSLFLATGKRVAERKSLGEEADIHRGILRHYPPGYLEGVMHVAGSSVLVTYTMYVISRHALVYTVPLCAFGLLRYLLRVQSGFEGDPTDSLLRDRPLLCVSVLWALAVGWGIYGG